MVFPRIVYAEKPQWEALYQKAVKTALNNVDRKEYRPGWLPQMTCLPGIPIIWQWDSCFMAIYAKYLNGVIAPMNNLDNLYSLQSEDGYISMAYRIIEGVHAYGERINPPLYAWCEWEYYRFSNDQERLRKVLPILVKYYKWIRKNRRRDNGLYYFEDTGSSGMDNSPRSGYSALHQDGSDVCWVDLGCQQVLSAKYIALIAEELLMPELAEEFKKEAESLGKIINEIHYKRKTGFYYDTFISTGNALANKTIAGFWPFLAGITDKEKEEALLTHLTDPAEFATPHPVPSLSADDPNFDPDGGYWLGGVWAPTNYMVVKGLDHIGKRALAREIVTKHLDMMVLTMEDPEFASIWESYSPTKPLPSTTKRNTESPYVRPNVVGWSALGPVAMFIEDILGLDFDAVKNLVSWHISAKCTHGLEDFQFAGKKISFHCDGIKEKGNTLVRVHSGGNFLLQLTLEGRDDLYTFEVKEGENTFLC